MNKLQTKHITIDNLQFIHKQGAIAVIQHGSIAGTMEINTLLPPLLSQIVGRPIQSFSVIRRRSSGGILAVAFSPILQGDPVLPVPINCPSLIYPRSFVTTMRKFSDHILLLGNRYNNLDLTKWYRDGELFIEDVLDNINLLRLNQFDRFTFELIIKTTLAQPFRTD